MSFSLTDDAAASMLATLAAVLDGGFIRIFSGSRPASPALAETGTLLGVVTTRGEQNAGLHYDVIGANLTKPATPWVFQALADGDAGWFRVVGANDPGGVSYAVPRLDGDIGTEPGHAMVWPSLALQKEFHYTLDAFVYLLF